MKHKLTSQADYIGRRDFHTRAQLDAKRMRLCVKLMGLVQDEFYSSEYSDYHKTKHWFEPVPGKEGYSSWESRLLEENFDDYFKKYPLIYKRVINGEGIFSLEDHDNVSTDKKQRIAMNIGHINQERAHKLLFKIMEENIEGWYKAGVCAVGLGSKLISKKLMEAKDYATMESETKTVLELIQTIKNK
jgi:hypothetical protein